ncbi:hypothetical protein PG988_012586 [Apiospora saccharicola]
MSDISAVSAHRPPPGVWARRAGKVEAKRQQPIACSPSSATSPELRLLIWKEALAVDCVWAAVLAERETSRMDGCRFYPIEARFRMRFVGPSPPHLVGQACREARDAMRAVFGRPFRGPRGAKAHSGDPEQDGGEEGPYYWLNPATTVFVLHSPKETRRLLDGFAPQELARLQHLAFFWAHWATIAALNARLRQDCPQLQTLVIEKGRLCYEKLPDHLRYPEIDEPTAERYARLSRPETDVVCDHWPQSHEFRARTWAWKTKVKGEGDTVSAPRIHLLTDLGTVAKSGRKKQTEFFEGDHRVESTFEGRQWEKFPVTRD